MALSFDLTEIENHKQVCYDDTGTMTPVTELLIFTTMHVGMGKITTDTAAEFYARMIVAHKLYDIGIVTPDGTKMLEPEHVQQHIGLSTNVSPEPRQKWLRRLFTDKYSGLLNEFGNNYKREIKEKAKV